MTNIFNLQRGASNDNGNRDRLGRLAYSGRRRPPRSASARPSCTRSSHRASYRPRSSASAASSAPPILKPSLPDSLGEPRSRRLGHAVAIDDSGTMSLNPSPGST